MNADSNEEAVYIEELMKRFKLVDIRNEYKGLIREAAESNMSHLEFLKRLLEIEAEGKNNRKQERLRNAAGFETMKKLEELLLYDREWCLNAGQIKETYKKQVKKAIKKAEKKEQALKNDVEQEEIER